MGLCDGADRRTRWACASSRNTHRSLLILTFKAEEVSVPEPTKQQARRFSGKAIIVGLVLLLIAGISTVLAVFAAGQADQWTMHSLEVRLTTERLFSRVQDAETGQRGFLLTGDQSYLAPFTAAERDIPGIEDRLRSLTSDNRQQQLRLDGLYTLIDRKLKELRRTLELAQAGDAAAARGGRTCRESLSRSALGAGLLDLGEVHVDGRRVARIEGRQLPPSRR